MTVSQFKEVYQSGKFIRDVLDFKRFDEKFNSISHPKTKQEVNEILAEVHENESKALTARDEFD